ncbi:MAG TPA: flagellar basal body rod protein FlgB [Oleiagrimonas sp.]|nr:flagellar basal body rod protein FlgB [Oleiagrimonas sp.]
MIDQLASAFHFDRQAVALRARRQKVLANNIANADTPGYKARDFKFADALTAATGGSEAGGHLSMATTSPRHIEPQAGNALPVDLLYRVPAQPSLDGNTVDMNEARTRFADNSLRYMVSLHLMSGKIRGLRAAMQPAR